MSERRYPCGVEGCTDPECTLDPPEQTIRRTREGITSDTEYTPTSEEMTIETIIGLFADEAAEFGEPRDTALERAYRALAAHDAELTARVRAEQIETDAQIAEDAAIGWNHDYDNGCFDAAAAIREAGKTEEAE